MSQDINNQPSEQTDVNALMTDAPETATQETAPAQQAEGETETQQQKEAKFTQDDLNRVSKEERLRYQQKLQTELQRQQQQYQQTYGAPQQTNSYEPQIQNPNPQSQEFMQMMQTWQQQQEVKQIFDNEQKSLMEAAGKYEDFHEVVNDPTLPITQAMREAIALTGDAGDFWYTAANNQRSELDRIASLPSYRQQAEILVLKGRLSAGIQQKVTSAPQPLQAEQDSRAPLSTPRASSVDDAHRQDFQRKT